MFSQFYQVSSTSEVGGMSETQLKEYISKLKLDNSTLESEIVKLKSDISNSMNAQNELKSKNMDLGKELHQSRLQLKLKISQLQKEIASERSRSLSVTPPPLLTGQTVSSHSILPVSQTTGTQSMTDQLECETVVTHSTATQATAIMTDQSQSARPVETQSSATQAIAAKSIFTRSIATQVAHSQLKTSSEPVNPPADNIQHDIVMADTHSQTEKDDSAAEKRLKMNEYNSQTETSLIAAHCQTEMDDSATHSQMEKNVAAMYSQTENDFIAVEISLKQEEEAVAKVKEELMKKMEEKIKNLRNSHKVNINGLSVQIQELKAELKNSQIIKKKLDDANKTLEESTVTLQTQVEILKEEKENTRDKFQEYEKNREENEEKIKKMKGLLIAANKKLLEYKELAGNLRKEIQEANDKEKEISGNEEELTRKVQEEKDKYEDKIQEILKQSEDKIQEITKENEKQQGIITEKNKELDNLMQEKDKIHKEFQDYKIKAQLALQQSANSNGSEGKISHLEEFNSKLESDIAGLEADIIQLNDKMSQLKNELIETINSNLHLNGKLSEMQTKSKERFHLQQDLENLRKEFEKLKLSHQQDIDKITEEHKDKQEKLKHQITNLILDAKTSLEDNNQKNTEYLNITQNLKAELAQARNQIEQLKTNSGAGRRLSTSGRPSSPFGEKLSGMHSPPLRQSSSNILSHLDHGGVSSFKVKEMVHKIDQLSLLLTESEANVERLLEQEKFLKEQLRSQDRIEVLEKRLSIEYLKNIVLSFFESKSKESLIPVLARVLELSLEEEQKLRNTTGASFSFI